MEASSWDLGAGVLAACIQEALLASEIAARRRDSDGQTPVRPHILTLAPPCALPCGLCLCCAESSCEVSVECICGSCMCGSSWGWLDEGVSWQECVVEWR